MHRPDGAQMLWKRERIFHRIELNEALRIRHRVGVERANVVAHKVQVRGLESEFSRACVGFQAFGARQGCGGFAGHLAAAGDT